MSHLRNLFYQRPVYGANPAPAHSSPPITTTVAHAFPVEEVELRPEVRLVYHSDPRSAAADRFRLLRMRLKTFWKAGKLKKLLITGPLPHDGKSTVVLNLATALSERGKCTVLVIEADLHHSSLGDLLGLAPWPGLADCLADESISPLSAIRRIEPLGWCLLPAGRPRKNPTELLQTPAIGYILERLSAQFDWILIDSPPVIPVTDSISLQQHVDASLLVVRAGRTPREAVEQCIALLGKQNVLGVVLNGMEERDRLGYQYYGGTMSQP